MEKRSGNQKLRQHPVMQLRKALQYSTVQNIAILLTTPQTHWTF